MSTTATDAAPLTPDRRAFLLRSGGSQAAHNLACLYRVTSLALDALARDEGMATGTPDALRWLGSRLNDAAETLEAIVEQRPVRWHLAADPASDVGRCLDMLAADDAPDGDE